MNSPATITINEPMTISLSNFSLNINTPIIDYELPDPIKKIDEEITNIILTGIGGTGVLTISAILGMAANI